MGDILHTPGLEFGRQHVSCLETLYQHVIGTQLEIKQYLERLYGLRVAKVRTLNVEGTKKRSKHGFYRRPDFKKAYVTLKPQKNVAATQ